MRYVTIMLAILCLTLTQHCLAADRPLAEWQFAEAADTQGWVSAGGAIAVDKVEGALTSTGTDCKVVSPLFDIKASPWQVVEVEMKTDKDGVARVFYSNTTEEPYGGFRDELQTQLSVVGDGQYHKYVVFPGWQSQGKIIHIRIDPPGENNAIRHVRIAELSIEKAASATEWVFAATTAGWHAYGADKEPAVLKTGWTVDGTRNTLALSPALDFAADDLPCLTLRLASKSPHTVLFKWICAGKDGVQSLPIDVKGGGKFHSYVIDLTTLPEWSGRIAAVGVTPTTGANADTVTIESVTLAKTPVGPAEIRINRLELADPVTRVGSKAKVVVEIENIGGTAARSAAAVVMLLSDVEPKVLSVKSVDYLAAGKTARIEWETTFNSAGAISAASSASADKVDPDQKQALLHVYPKLEAAATKGMSYVPEPTTAKSGGYSVGCYYFPGWRDYGAWSVLNDFPERKPILGYANDGNPEVVDWQINWALSHGIEFFIYDWYWNKGGRHLEEGLHDGLFKAKYQDKMKFCLLWANHNGPGSHSEADMLAVTQYWIDNYFKRPNYMKLNGKNVMVIFNPSGIIQDMGLDGAKAAIVKMKKMCEDSGAGGLYLVGCVYPNTSLVTQLEKAGFDALSGYNYPGAGDKGQNVAPYEWMVDGYNEIWSQIADTSRIPYIPLCEAGWDSRPWHGPSARVRTCKSAELWQRMLTNAKDFEDYPSHRLAEGKKLVFCEAWNEFGEGDYIEPNAGDGFDYLEAVRQVFAPQSKKPVIVTPKDLGMGPYDIAPPPFRTAWDFSKTDERVWTPAGMATPTYDAGVLRTEATGGDPMLSALWVEIDAAKYKTLEIRMKTDKANEAQMFFTQKRYGLSEDRSVKFAVTGDDQFHTYTVNMAANAHWNGTITGLRFDPTSAKGSKIEIAGISFRE